MSKSSTSVTMKAMKLDHNVTAIDLCDGGKSYGHTQIMNILKRKREILDDFENNVPSSRKRQHRVTGNENINKLCWDWFQDFCY